MSEPAPVPEAAPPSGGGSGRLIGGFLFGIVLMLAILYFGAEVTCPTCDGTGRAIGRGAKIRWQGSTSGVECMICGGTGMRRRYTTLIEGD